MSDQPSQHKFRYLLPPGTNFSFTSKFKAWMTVSILLMVASIGMLFVNKQVRGEYLNWTIDFKGGTEMVLAFQDKATGEFSTLDIAKARQQLESIDNSIEVTELTFTGQKKNGDAIDVEGLILRTTRFSALTPELGQKVVDDFNATFKDRELHKVAWSGDRLMGVSLNMDEAGEAWVQTLGVLREMRGKGLGRALLIESFREFHRRGHRQVLLGVDSESLTGATRLYESAGMVADRTWDHWERDLD